MEQTLDLSLAAVFGDQVPEPTPTPTPAPSPGTSPTPTPAPSGEVEELLETIEEHLEKMQEYAGAGEWAQYGEELEALEDDILKLKELVVEGG
jgi:uncharacterized membrane protein (UPF0182 family)